MRLFDHLIDSSSESSMYLPVAPDKSKHRRSLNLLEVPQPHHGPQVKQSKVETGNYFPLKCFFLCDWSRMTLMSLDSPTVLLTCTCLRTQRATQTLQLWFGSWKSVQLCRTRLTCSTSSTWWSMDTLSNNRSHWQLLHWFIHTFIHTMFHISAEQRSRLAGGVVGSRTGRSQCSLLAGGVVRAGWSLQRVGTHQIHLWDTTQEGGGLSWGESQNGDLESAECWECWENVPSNPKQAQRRENFKLSII